MTPARVSALWTCDAKLGIIAAPVTYRAGLGQQYVSVLVGYGGIEAKFGNDRGWKYGAQPRRLLTFKLDGQAKLPATPGSTSPSIRSTIRNW